MGQEEAIRCCLVDNQLIIDFLILSCVKLEHPEHAFFVMKIFCLVILITEMYLNASAFDENVDLEKKIIRFLIKPALLRFCIFCNFCQFKMT